jgi:2-hydroxychromene-2-carboxylate isomerase
MAKVEFFFDFGSPTTYLAYLQLPKIAARTGAEIVYRPMLLGGVFKATGNSTPAAIPAKARFMHADLTRYAARYGVPFVQNPHFPINTLHLMRGAVAAQRLGCFTPYCDAVYDAIWAKRKAMGDPKVVAEVLSEAGIDARALFALLEDQGVKDELRATTEEAVARGAFGAPTFFVDGVMFFGQDRLEFVEEALAGAKSSAA